MKWKKFKKERISLNYTVMLVPHSQKKPIHFKTPVWTFGVVFLGLFVLSGACLFFAGSRAGSRQQLSQVRMEKAQLEQEWEQLTEQKRLADEENEALKEERRIQELELLELERKTRGTLKELEELVERENQIRQELGLGQILADAEDEASAEASENGGQEEGSGGTDGDSPASSEDGQGTEDGAGEGEQPAGADGALENNGTLAREAQSRPLQIASADLPLVLAQNSASFEAIQAELSYLQNQLDQKSGQYDKYLTTIEEKKTAEAADKARKEALRASIVTNALQYVGNAYVYGGNNPNTGVDCSGFTRYILGNTAGVYLNRTAAAQSTQGRAVSAENARPGDLVFYSNGSTVNHVAIYIGNGQVVHASNERVGIITSNMYYRTPVKIVNMLGD